MESLLIADLRFYRRDDVPEDIAWWASAEEDHPISIVIEPAGPVDAATTARVAAIVPTLAKRIAQARAWLAAELRSWPLTATEHAALASEPFSDPEVIVWDGTDWMVRFASAELEMAHELGIGVLFEGDDPVAVEDLSEAGELEQLEVFCVDVSAVAAHPQNAVALTCCHAVHAVARRELRRHPALQRVGPELAGNNEPRVASLVKARNPPLKQAMQFVLPDTNRGVRPDSAEHDVVRYFVWSHGANVVETELFGIPAGQFERPFVDIDCPHSRVRGERCHREGDGSPTATDVEKIATWGWGWGACEQHSRASVEPIRAESSAGSIQLDRAPGDGN